MSERGISSTVPALRLAPGGPARFYALTCAASWTIWFGTWLATGRPAHLGDPAMLGGIYAGSLMPTLVAAGLAWRAGQLRDWLAGYRRWRMGWPALTGIALLPLAVLILTVVLGYVPGRDRAGLPPFAFYATLFPVALLNGVATALLGAGPLGEEGGWRGYLLPTLLVRLGEVRASLLLGLGWALWHWPIMVLFPEWRDGVALAVYAPLYTVGVIGLALLMTRLWLLARGSLWAMIWLHGVVNALGGVAFNPGMWRSTWSAEAGLGHFAMALWLTALVVRRFPLPRDNPA